MSLLEDVFLEDEAGEAQELERVIEGDELDDRPRTPDSNEDREKEDEAEEDKRVVDHTAKAKKVVKNPRFVLNPARLMGPRGIQVVPEHFKDFKFKGKGHEREDLDFILKKLEHWAYRLYPKFKFDDCLKKIEALGKKRPVMVHLHKIRTDQYLSEETVQQQDSSGDEAAAAPPPEDEFDRLLQQQIELARSTPGPGSARKELDTPMSHNRSPLMVPKVSSSPSINDEQKERMMRNRRLAEERRLARLNQSNASLNTNNSIEIPEQSTEVNASTTINDEERTINETKVMNDDHDNITVVKKHNRTNVIDSDSSDDDNEVMAVNEPVTVDVHSSVVNNVENNEEHSSDKENREEIVVEPNGISKDVSIDKSKMNEDVAVEITEKGNPHIENTAEELAMESDEKNNSQDDSIDNHKSSTNTESEDVVTEINLPKETSKHLSKSERTDGTNSNTDIVKENSVSTTTTNEKEMVVEPNGIGKDVSIDNSKMNENVAVAITEKDNPHIENTAEEIAMESDEKINSQDDSIDNNKSSRNTESEDVMTEINLPNEVTSKHLSNSESTKGMNINADILEENSVSTTTANKKDEQTTDTVAEDLMDVDFSDDF